MLYSGPFPHLAIPVSLDAHASAPPTWEVRARNMSVCSRRWLASLVVLLASCNAGPTEPDALSGLGGPLLLLDRQRVDKFVRGIRFFDRDFTPETGLGPLYNATSCVQCHDEPVRGGGGPE